MDNTDFTTVSYHCESDPPQKKVVRNNLQTMMDNGYNFKVNIMFHENPEYYQECIELAKWCDDNHISYTPRIIGDQGNTKLGIKDKTVHVYTQEQMAWMKRYWKAKGSGSTRPAHDAEHIMETPTSLTPKKKVVGQNIGRPCCGGRNLRLKHGDEWTTGSFVTNNKFPGMVMYD